MKIPQCIFSFQLLRHARQNFFVTTGVKKKCPIDESFLVGGFGRSDPQHQPAGGAIERVLLVQNALYFKLNGMRFQTLSSRFRDVLSSLLS